MHVQKLTKSAIFLALIVVSFLLFRGTTNIFNAVIVPLLISITIKDMKIKEGLTFIAAIILLGFMFFRFQIFFIILYALLAVMLLYTKKNNYRFSTKALFFSATSAVGFFIVIRMTDLVLGSPIERALIAISGGSFGNYLTLLLAQGLFVGLMLATMTKVKQFDL